MAQKRYEYLPHTADVAFVAHGRTFESALENAALALMNLMLDTKGIEAVKAEEKEVAVRDSARSAEDLVWYVLQDILSLIDAKKLNAFDFRVDKSSEKGGKHSVEGKLICKNSKGDFSLMSVKAVTPHGLEVRKGKGGYSISVVADV